MDIEIIEQKGIRFANLQKLNKRDEKRLFKLPYRGTVVTNHGFFEKVYDFKFEEVSNRAGFALIDMNDVEKYYEYDGKF